MSAVTADFSLSYELFPPRDARNAEDLFVTIDQLAATDPDYVSVTYGAAGRNHGLALGLLTHLVGQTRLRPLAHLTAVGFTVESFRATVAELLDIGVRGVLAVRGDLPDDGAWPLDHELEYAVDLVRLIRDVEARQASRLAAGRLAVGVTAFPTKHPESSSVAADVRVLLAKQAAGADFAITQVFFDPDDYRDLVTRSRAAGVTIPIVPGVLPMTNERRICRMAELASTPPPRELLARLEAADPEAKVATGVDLTADFVRRLIDAGAPGLHLYTFNRHHSALRVLERLDLRRARAATTSAQDLQRVRF